MPVQECEKEGKKGKKFGESGHCYFGTEAERKAYKQGAAEHANKDKKGK